MCSKSVVVGFDLRSKVQECGRDGEVFSFVVVVQSEVKCHGDGGIVSEVGEEELGVGTTAPAVGEEVTVASADDDVFWRELSQHLPHFICFLHGAIVHVLRHDRQSVSFSECFGECRAHPGATADVVHEVQFQREVACVGIECGVLPSDGRCIFNERHVFSAQRGGVGHGGELQHVERCCAFLCGGAEREERAEKEKNIFFHELETLHSW